MARVSIADASPRKKRKRRSGVGCSESRIDCKATEERISAQTECGRWRSWDVACSSGGGLSRGETPCLGVVLFDVTKTGPRALTCTNATL